jgi:DNA-binding transcriptional ArsR family regulator
VVNNLDAVYAALADPTRRSMVERLRGGELSVSALGEPYGMTLAAIGKHVTVLETAGIVRTRKSGRVRSCALVPSGLDDATGWLREQEAFWHDRIDALTAYLEEDIP